MFELGLYIGVLITGVFTYLGYLLCEIKHRRKRYDRYKYLRNRYRKLDIPKFVQR